MSPRSLALLAALSSFAGTYGCERSPSNHPPLAKEGAPPAQPAGTKPTGAAPAAPSAAAAPAVPPAAAAQEPPKKLLAQGLERYRDMQSLHAQARQALAAGDKATALGLLNDVLTIAPGNHQALMDKLRILRETGQHEKAIAAIDDALKRSPANMPLVEEKVWNQMEKGDPRDALQTITSVLKPGSALPGLRYLRAVVCASLEDKEGALAALEDAEANGFYGYQQIESEKRFQPVAGEKRFQDVVTRIKDVRIRAQKAGAMLQALEEGTRLPEASPGDNQEDASELQTALAAGRGENLDIELNDIDGNSMRLADHKGQVVLVQAWGMWSPGSRKMIPGLMRLRDEYRDKGLHVLALCFEPAADPDSPEEVVKSVKAHMRDFGFDVQCALIGAAYSAGTLFVGAYPTTLLFGKDGKLYLRSKGPKDYPFLKQLVEKLLNAPSPAPAPLAPPGEKK